jgi:hypothetical protein
LSRMKLPGVSYGMQPSTACKSAPSPLRRRDPRRENQEGQNVSVGWTVGAEVQLTRELDCKGSAGSLPAAVRLNKFLARTE